MSAAPGHGGWHPDRFIDSWGDESECVDILVLRPVIDEGNELEGVFISLEHEGRDEGYARFFEALSAFVRLQQEYFKRFVGPSLIATINEQQVTFNSIVDKFDMLERTWREYNLGRSRIEYNHFAHYQIVGMGMSVIPLLLERVDNEENEWIIALKAITGAMPDADETLGDSASVRQSWVDWGIANGYSIFTRQALGCETNTPSALEDDRP